MSYLRSEIVVERHTTDGSRTAYEVDGVFVAEVTRPLVGRATARLYVSDDEYFVERGSVERIERLALEHAEAF